MNFDEYIKAFDLKLNDKQMEAVKATEGPVLLLAVPGSGKTTVLVSRLGYMLYCRGIPADSILTLTYTVSAAADMKKRFISLFGNEHADSIEFRTINGICAKVIHFFSQHTGRPAFNLMDNEGELGRLVGEIYKAAAREFPAESDIKSVRTDITYIKNMKLDDEGIRKLEDERDYPLSKIYKAYVKYMLDNRLMDYDDQMVYAEKMLRSYPYILEHFQSMYPYILVDEAQDTSKIQHDIISLLAGKKDNLFMVGDEDQSIYGFRAAYPDALLNFRKEHENALVITMEENYRSDENIVKMADSFIQKNLYRYEKSMKANRSPVNSVKFIDMQGRSAQYEYLKKIASDCQVETACLYRNNESAIPLIDVLERAGIPYRMAAPEIAFFSHRTVLDICDIAEFSINPRDEAIFMNIYYKLGTYLSKDKAIEACRRARQEGVDILDAAIRFCHLPAHTIKSCRLIYDQFERIKTDRAEAALNRICGLMGYSEYMEKRKQKDTKISILRSLAIHEDSMQGLVERLKELESIIRNKERDYNCNFILSTFHSSKGLEYDSVYLLDVSDGIFPQEVPADRKDKDYQEERRIFYVAMTRARNELNILKLPSYSSFIKELESLKPKKSRAGFKGEFDASDIKEGVNIVHKTWGRGKVIKVTGDRFEAEFDAGIKKMSIDLVIERNLIRKAEDN